MEIPKSVYIGLLTLLLIPAKPTESQDPLIRNINRSGQKIARVFNEKRLVPAKPDPRLVDKMREPIDLLRGGNGKKGGFSVAIDKASVVVLESNLIDAATHSCISEVAAATRLPPTRLQQASDEEVAYLLRIMVDAGITIAHRNGLVPAPCP